MNSEMKDEIFSRDATAMERCKPAGEENNLKKYDIILVYYLLYLYNKITYHAHTTITG